MTKSNTTEADSPEPNEGEGNKTAARHYSEGVAKTVQSGKVEEKAREAAEALDGEEGDELRRAEKEAKNKSPSP
jgi:hypothetical protein